MSNPNQSPSNDIDVKQTEWDSLSEVEFAPLAISTDGISKINLSDAPMGEGRQDKRVDVADASGIEKRTSNLMLGYNEKGVQIGETYLSIEEFRERALEDLESEATDETSYVRKADGKYFAEPRAVVDDMIATITGAGPEATLSDNPNITNQDARSVQFTGPNGQVQRGVFMLGNNKVNIPNGLYADVNTVEAVSGNYATVTEKEPLISPVSSPEETFAPPLETSVSEHISDASESENGPNEDLHQATLELAELYAKNRRLIPGAGTREKFEAARQEYQRLLAEHLANFSHDIYNSEFDSLSKNTQSMANTLAAQNIDELTEFVGGDLNHPTKTPEEIESKREELRRAAEAKMKEEYPDMAKNLEVAVTAEMLEEYTKVRSELEEATIDALDNGTACRQAVSKIITNKWTKTGLAVAAATGLAVAAIGIGQGVADDSLVISLGYQASGIAAGAARGGAAGALMSRQSSKTSAIRDYGNKTAESIEDRINNGERITAESLAKEAMTDYATSNQKDSHSNKVKTAISASLGASIGAAASGIHIDNVINNTTNETTQIGVTPEQYEVDLSKIDIEKGSGMGEVFSDLGGDPSSTTEAIKIAQQFDMQHGMVPGSNGIVPGTSDRIGDFAHVYPGTIDTWPSQAREYITQVAQEWAEQGLIESAKTGGEPIFSTIEKTVIDYIPNLFYNMLIQAEAAAVSGVAGGVIGGIGNTVKASTATEEQPQQ